MVFTEDDIADILVSYLEPSLRKEALEYWQLSGKNKLPDRLLSYKNRYTNKEIEARRLEFTAIQTHHLLAYDFRAVYKMQERLVLLPHIGPTRAVNLFYNGIVGWSQYTATVLEDPLAAKQLQSVRNWRNQRCADRLIPMRPFLDYASIQSLRYYLREWCPVLALPEIYRWEREFLSSEMISKLAL